jgi:hypothetical protein
MSIDMLPDDVLLVIFDFYVTGQSDSKEEVETWQTLVHVCRQWRTVVFGSPRRLRLRLHCPVQTRTLLRDTPYVWPAFSLVIQDAVNNTKELDNTIAVLERSDRVYHIILASSYLENILATMQKPFPELTYPGLISFGAATVTPDSFLGGFAPRLQSLSLDGIPFPGLPNLLLSATHLVNLSLSNISRSGYISPEGIVTAISTLTSLRRLSLGFESPRSLPDRESRHPPPLTRSVLPTLRALSFKGLGEYLEDLVALIDAPQLCFLSTTLSN